MATEVELKLSASPRALAAVSKLPWIRKMGCGSPTKQRLVSIYFDTPDGKLHRNGATWRIRKSGRQCFQTIKTAPDASDNSQGRGEWEKETDDDTPDLALTEETPVSSLLGRNSRRALRPVFETKIERTTLPLRAGESQLELSIDRGWIRANGSNEPVREIELELKEGDPAGIASVAAKLAQALPVSFGALAKSDRGYALYRGESGEAVEARDIRLDCAASVAGAFRVIGMSCLQHAVSNETAVCRNDSEGIHQFRVGLRRLRAAISVFKELLEGPETEKIKSGLKWLTDQFSHARDLDVLTNKSLLPLERTSAGRQEVETLATEMDGRRKEAFAGAKHTIDSPPYRKTILDAALWLTAGNWANRHDELQSAVCDRSVRDFAREILPLRAKKIVRKCRKLREMTPRQQHKLRIAVKKLRYATEFFESLFPGSKAKKARKSFQKAVRELQHALGAVHDIQVHRAFAEKFVHARKPGEETYAMGILTGSELERADACISSACKAGKKLGKAKRFWN